ncbi:MAG: hypothetical protein ACKOAF_02145 [Actinomycetes bacterium]
MKGSFQLKRFLAPFFLGVLTTAYFFLPAHYDPEPYHDGSQFAGALGLTEGLATHAEVFSAYGFLTTWIQGAAVAILGPSLLSIRILTILTILIAVLLTYSLLNSVLRKPWLSVLACSAWVVMWPGISVNWGTPLLPWPSLVYLDFQLACVVLILKIIDGVSHPRMYLFFAAFFGSLALLTRINYGLFFCLFMLFALVAFRRHIGLNHEHFAPGIIGFLSPLIVSGVVLLATSSLRDYVEQSITGPLNGAVKTSATDLLFLENAYLRASLPIFIALGFVLWLSRRWDCGSLVFGVVIAAVTGVLTAISTTAILESPLRDAILTRLTWAPGLDTQAMQACFVFAIVTIAATLGMIVVLLVRKLASSPRFLSKKSLPWNGSPMTFYLLLLAALSSLVQLFPIADPNHLWWAVPLPLAFTCFILCYSASSRTTAAVACVLFAPMLLIAPFTGFRYYEVPRSEANSPSLAGMYVKTSLASDFAKVDDFLASLEPRSTKFLCHGGLFATWTGEYLASDADYVDYAYGTDQRSLDLDPDSVVYCEERGAEGAAAEYAETHGLRVVDETGPISLSYFAQVNLVRLAR